MGDRAIVLTGPGAAGIAVVRLVGAGVGAFLQGHFTRPTADGKCAYGQLRDGETVIDDAVVVASDKGRVADLNVHGGVWVVHRVLELARAAGFDVVHPAIPPPLDTVEGDTLLEREVMAWLPSARTELALRTLLRQVELWKAFVPSATEADIRATLDRRALFHLLNPPRVAIVGVPNVGKSTIANQLFAQERSITADLPGTTRDWVGEIANIDGLPVMLVDTPGVRESGDAIEREAIARSSSQVHAADLVVVVLDPTQAWEEQLALAEKWSEALLVVNKADRARTWDIDRPVIKTVGTTGEGIDVLRDAMKLRFGIDEALVHTPSWWTERQRSVLERGLSDPSALSAFESRVDLRPDR